MISDDLIDRIMNTAQMVDIKEDTKRRVIADLLHYHVVDPTYKNGYAEGHKKFINPFKQEEA